LVPLFHRPLAEWAMQACAQAGIEHFAVNTHHLPQAWADFGTEATPPSAFTGANGQPAMARTWAGRDLTLFHEPVLLETGGGLKNIADWLRGEPVLVHNGDIFSTMPLAQLIAAHAASGLPATLALRSRGEALHIAVDATATRCTDIRGRLGRAEGTHVFSGVYCVNPELLDRLPAGEKVSVIPAFLELAREGRLGVVVLDDGEWRDLGDRTAYLQVHRDLALGPAIHPAAVIETGARVMDSVIGPGAVVRAGAVVRNSVVWPGCEVAASAVLTECIVFSNNPATGIRHGEDC
jgi:NDP-sugar pyrophosphorylase family protein